MSRLKDGRPETGKGEKMTPAVEAKLTDHVWTVEELLNDLATPS
jgi:hypothetical protein